MLFVEIALGFGNVVDKRVSVGRGSRVTAGREKRESAEKKRERSAGYCQVEVLPPSSVATPCLNANVSWPACVGVHTKVCLNVRHRVVSPARIAERTASPEIRLKLYHTSGLRGSHQLCLLFIHPRAPSLISLRSTGTMST